MASWSPENFVLTAQGRQMLSLAEANGLPMTITQVKTGGGRSNNLANLTNVSSPNGSMTIVRKTADSNGTLIDLQLENSSVHSSYSINQVGIFASNSSMGEVLFMVAQCDSGTADTVPTSSTPVVLHYRLLIAHSSSAQISVNYVATGYAMQDDLDALQEDVTDSFAYVNQQLEGIEEKIHEYFNYICGVDSYDDDVYGVEVDFNPSGVSSPIYKRLGASANLQEGSDFDNILPWKRRRCLLTNTGEVVCYYGDTGYSTSEGGKLSSAITVGTGTNAKTFARNTIVQVMVEQPKFYYRTVPLKMERISNSVGSIQTYTEGWVINKARYYISPYPKPGFKVFPLFETEEGEVNYVYLPAYRGCLERSNSYDQSDSFDDFPTDYTCLNNFYKLSSVRGVKPVSGRASRNFTRYAARVWARNRNLTSLANSLRLENSFGEWKLKNIAAVMCSAYLFLIEYATFNYAKIDYGVCDVTDDGSSNLSHSTGATTSLGNSSGKVGSTAYQYDVSYRGEENLWGNQSQWIDGINVLRCYDNKHEYVCRVFVKTKGEIFYPQKEDGDGQTDIGLYAEDRTSEGYTDIGFILPFKPLTGKFVIRFGYSKQFDWGFLPIKWGESLDSIPKCYFNPNDPDFGWHTVVSYNAWNSRSGGLVYSGLLSLGLRKINTRDRTIGASIMFIPKVEPVYDNNWFTVEKDNA